MTHGPSDGIPGWFRKKGAGRPNAQNEKSERASIFSPKMADLSNIVCRLPGYKRLLLRTTKLMTLPIMPKRNTTGVMTSFT